jgi:hypothetical protein
MEQKKNQIYTEGITSKLAQKCQMSKTLTYAKKNVTADRHHVISQKTSFEVSAVAQQKILFFQYMTLHRTVI